MGLVGERVDSGPDGQTAKQQQEEEEISMESVKGFRPVAINVGVRNIEEGIEFYARAFGEERQR